MKPALYRICVLDRYKRIVRRELATYIPVEVMPPVQKVARS